MLDKTYRPQETEAKHYARWERSGAFGAHPESNAEPYTIMIPPPNVTGSLHMGHALTFTIQDALIRYQRMKGRDALWQPGTDHAGIATQMVVERQLAEEGKTRHDLGREAFVERVWQWKAESGGTITRQLRRLGASLDWSRERFTMDEGLSLAVRKVFVELYKAGLIYRDRRLVNWDPKLHTAISDLEVVQTEVQGHLWHIRYPLESGDGFVVVATTRPETMLGDTAVAVHPDDERWKPYVGQYAIVPLVGRRVPIVADDYADPEKGSGAVKITPAHDFNDFEVGKRHGLPMINVMNGNAALDLSQDEFRLGGGGAEDGRWGTIDGARSAYDGLDREEARKRIVADLEGLGLLDKIEPQTHMVPYGDRGGVPIEPFLTLQWYCDAKTLAAPAIRAVEEGRTVFVPKHWENTYFEWMRNIQPWCISRQIWWGHQVPAWYGPDGTIFVEMTEEAAATAARLHYGRNVELTRDGDVLDTWFSSALWPFSTLGWPEETRELKRYYPTDVLVTGFDIIFFWVARMMMMGLHFMGDVPFRTVYIHALVRDAKGQKMSKSKGNVLDPLLLIDKYGADAVRFTLAALAAQGRDIKLAESRIEGYRNFATKLWNAARYVEMNEGAIPAGYAPENNRQTANRWIVTELVQVTRQVSAAFDAYRFNEAANALYQFTWGSYCDWYVEFTKPTLQAGDEAAKAETRATLLWVLHRLLTLLHPIMPFITEELWEELGPERRTPLIVSAWPELSDGLIDAEAAAEMNWVTRLIGEIRAVRSEMNVPAAARIPLLVQGANAETRQRLATHGDVIRTLARLVSIEEAAALPKGCAQAVIEETTLALPLADVIDIERERQRLTREIAKFAGEIDKIDRKLANEQFTAKAPPEVIEEQRERKAEAEQAHAKLKEALRRIADA